MNEQELKEVAAQLRKPHGEQGIQTAEWMNIGNLRIHQDALRILNVAEYDAILEIGMGNGLFVKDILTAPEHVSYTGCDYAELMVSEAKRINSDWMLQQKATFIQADIENLPFADHSFTQMLTINTIYFWENKAKALSEIKRVLKVGGNCVIAFRPKKYTEKYPFIQYGFNQFSKEDVVQLLLQNGFSDVKAFEHHEPDVVMHDEVMKMENVVVTAVAQ